MLFGKMMWKASGASQIKNTGVALVMADWYWGGINLGRFSSLLKEKGHAASFDKGSPDAATIAFINSLPPREVIELMSDAKAEQYRAIADNDPKQKKFLTGWLKRNEERREQAKPFVAAPAQGAAPATPSKPAPDAGLKDAENALAAARQRSALLAGPVAPAPELLPSPGPRQTPQDLGPLLTPKSDPIRQANAVAEIFKSEQRLLVAQATSLKQWAAVPGGNASAKYRQLYQSFAAMRDPWAGQLRAAIEAFRKKNPAGFGDAIRELEKLSDWLSNDGEASLSQVAAPP
jgi:hypothetical protein